MRQGRGSMPGNFASVIKAYLASPKFEALAEETRYGYRNELADAEEFLGHFSVDVIKPSIVQGFLDGLSDFPGKQIKSRVALKAVEKWAIVRDLLPYPITLGTEVVGSDGGHEPWTDTQVYTALQHARPDLARGVALAANTGQRGSDIVRMRWTDIEEFEGRKGINVTQKKTGEKLLIPLTHKFASELASWEKRPGFILINPWGRPYSRSGLSTAWAKHRDKNPALQEHRALGLSMHGLRAYAVVGMRREGWSTLEISSMVGMSEQMVNRYCRKANKNRLAMDAMNRKDNIKPFPSKALENK